MRGGGGQVIVGKGQRGGGRGQSPGVLPAWVGETWLTSPRPDLRLGVQSPLVLGSKVSLHTRWESP